MEKIFNTLDTPGIDTIERRSGRTTKQAKAAIEHLKNGYTVLVLDHHEDGKHTATNKYLAGYILELLGMEKYEDFTVKLGAGDRSKAFVFSPK